MKNLILYINRDGKFNENIETLAKLQIENMLELGWKAEDIILVTNCEWEFMGVKSVVVDDGYFFAPDPRSIKCIAVAKLFEEGLVFEDNELYWMHDIDHFQQLPITEEEIVKEMGDCDFALCDYGRRIKYNCGSIFFRKSAADIFIKIRDILYDHRRDHPECEEERATMILTTNNANWAFRSSIGAENSFKTAWRTDTEEVKKRIHKMPITYNFADYNMTSLWRMCDGNPKTAHFNPFFEKKTRSNPTGCRLDFFLGENKLGIPLLNKRLLRIFEKYGFTRGNQGSQFTGNPPAQESVATVS